MRKAILKVITIIIVYLISFNYLKSNIYNDYILPWFYLNRTACFFISFFLMNLYMYCYHISKYKKDASFYIALIISGLCFAINQIEIILIVLYILILVGGYITNSLYREDKKAGYLTLINLMFYGYLLLVNQVIVLIN